jgi:hypothetical protein
MARPDVSNPISWAIFLNLQQLYRFSVTSLNSPISKAHKRVKLNGFSEYALSCYPLAITAWEAFLNETCMSATTKITYPSSVLWKISEKAEKWDLEFKSIIIPELLLGKTLDKSKQPFQDFKHLISLRNHIIHFRLEEAPTKTLEMLAQRKLSLIPPDKARYSWPLQLMSTESIRWAINNIADMVSCLAQLFPYGHRPGNSLAFNKIDEKEACKLFRDSSVDPEEIYTPSFDQ